MRFSIFTKNDTAQNSTDTHKKNTKTAFRRQVVKSVLLACFKRKNHIRLEQIESVIIYINKGCRRIKLRKGVGEHETCKGKQNVIQVDGTLYICVIYYLYVCVIEYY